MAVDTATREPASSPDIEARSHDSLGLRIQHVLHTNPVLGPLAVLIIAIITFSIVNTRFFSAANLSLMLAQVTVIATLALGQTLIILTAGIDPSVGAIAVFSSILMANFAAKAGMSGIVSFVLALRDRHGSDQRVPGHEDQVAAVHRHPVHIDDLLLTEPGRVQERDGSRLRHARPAHIGPESRSPSADSG